MKLWDYECDTCGKREERWDDPPPVTPCTSPACSGSMARVLGGRPSSAAPRATTSPATRTVPALFFGYMRVPVKTRSDA